MSYLGEEDLNYLNNIPFEYSFRGMGQDQFVNRLSTERGLFSSSHLLGQVQAKPICLVVLLDRKADTNLEITLRSWQLQSCPQTSCLLLLLGQNANDSIRAWLRRKKITDVQVCDREIGEWARLAQSSDFVLFARPGDIFCPTLATALKLIGSGNQSDVVVWNVQQLSPNKTDASWNVKAFLRRPQFELHTIRHGNYIGVGFAAKSALVCAYPYDLIAHILYNDAHLFHIWLASQPEVKWYTHPEYLSLSAAYSRLACPQKLVEPFADTYQLLLGALPDFCFERQDNPDQPYQLKPRISAQSISIIIPFRDKPDEMRRCLASLLKQRIACSLEVVLVNNQSAPISIDQINAYINQYSSLSNTKIIDYNYPFNHSRQCNLGVEASSGEVIIFLNNDVELQSESVLEEMAAWALVSGVATVGCRIENPQDGRLCAGIKARQGTSPKNPTFIEESTDRRYAHIIRETYGNTFACAAMSRNTYNFIGPLNEKEFPNGYNDVEFLLRARRAGYTHIYLGHIQTHHSPGTSRGRCDEFLQASLLRRRFPQTSVDALFQLEIDYRLSKTSPNILKQVRQTPQAISSKATTQPNLDAKRFITSRLWHKIRKASKTILKFVNQTLR